MPRRHRPERSRGTTLPEYLVATSVLAIMMAFAVPLAAERIKTVKARTMASQLGNDLRAARWIAVSSRGPLDISVDTGLLTGLGYRSHIARAGSMPGSAGQVASSRPAMVTIHDDGNVARPGISASSLGTATLRR